MARRAAALIQSLRQSVGQGISLLPVRERAEGQSSGELPDTAQTFLGELLAAGFVLERLEEPQATEGARIIDPRRYEKTRRQPHFLAVRLSRP
ncbi:hypothetical protein [Streptomyces acidicola]|uniref:SAM-dependent methyltransferase n=1 Tax=Streptomyces acidicola TaxID=2596892 RepID=A0A5N8WKP8_9ACTN|nr:hypothetical protein [Streptomyces acidicola]MPY48011.1 hypothetical protein [Streptomyces acidicola]